MNIVWLVRKNIWRIRLYDRLWKLYVFEDLSVMDIIYIMMIIIYRRVGFKILIFLYFFSWLRVIDIMIIFFWELMFFFLDRYLIYICRSGI